jgi:NTE family protein
MPIKLAVRLSISMPFIFAALKYKGDIYTDGGVLDNYPIWYFKETDKTLGLKLVNQCERRDDQIYHDRQSVNNIKDFGTGIINAMLDQIDRLHVSDEYWNKTITIDTLGVSSTDFDLTLKEKDDLIMSGYESAEYFFKTYPKVTKQLLQQKLDDKNKDNKNDEQYYEEKIE